MDLDNELFVAFPAVRAPNFSDEVDMRTASAYRFKVRDLEGRVKNVSMEFFLENIGRYITDLEPSTNWADSIDMKEASMQVSSQFSVLPLVESARNRVDLGIAAFGYQRKNLHIVIGPHGDIGWAPEGHGYKRIFFRDNAGTHDSISKVLEELQYFEGSKYIISLISRFCLGFGQELRTIQLVPENRSDVYYEFFKPAPRSETIDTEAKRYAKVENRLIHIQIEIERTEVEHKDDFISQPELFSCNQLNTVARDLEKLLKVHKKLNRASKNMDTIPEKFSVTYPRPRKYVKGGVFEILVKTLTGKTIRINVKGGNTVSEVKVMIREREGIPVDQMRIIFAGIQLEDWKTLNDLNFSAGSVLNSVLRLRGGGGDWNLEDDQAARGWELDVPIDGTFEALGLQLARVRQGDTVGRADHSDLVPRGSRRAKGVAVRVTEMFYGVSSNASFTVERIFRFCQQMSFARRAGKLKYGSLVTGTINYG